ncbi:ABC transporter permease [Pseudonocardia oroxyli]|uniref:Peptide/nickel transport system permease protein n=1 Tax=Pseudonocardia oroxyli TaxID=366584 RepID=A0A1G7TTD0_PSEOR|nr:ABC transporter permease [Pseudonocardia oroxyli]SDG37959.1 peptide/nickel transport system permease protein [Pseudonocardia oroxyli]
MTQLTTPTPTARPAAAPSAGSRAAAVGRKLRTRLLHIVPVLLLVTFGSMLLVDLTPGDPAATILGESATPDQVAALRQQLGLDRPLFVRYGEWIAHIAQGDFGRSIRSQQPVLDAILERLPVTIELAILAQIMAFLVVIPLALYTAYRAGGRADRLANVVTSGLVSMPPFLTALLLVFVFALSLRAFPATGWVRIADDPLGNLRSAFLPALALALTELAVLTRVLRSDLIATLQEDFILSAKAKGLPTWYVLLRHALRPSSFSLVTLAGLSLGRLIGGAVIVETLFALPGIGQLLVNSILAKDAVVVQGVVVFVAIVYVALNVLTDVFYTILDPRTRVTGA